MGGIRKLINQETSIKKRLHSSPNFPDVTYIRERRLRSCQESIMRHFYSTEHNFCSHRIDVTAFVGSKCCEEEKDRQRFVIVIRCNSVNGQIERLCLHLMLDIPV